MIRRNNNFITGVAEPYRMPEFVPYLYVSMAFACMFTPARLRNQLITVARECAINGRLFFFIALAYFYLLLANG